MARIGPVTKDTSTVALGLAQIRVGTSSTNIATATAALSSSDSIGAMASTKYTGSVDYWRLESGFPLLEDYSIALRESAKIECEFKEITPYNLALARGIDPNAAVSATITAGDSVTTLGTTTGDLAVDNAGGVTTETWVVTFTGATAGVIVGTVTGEVTTFAAVDAEIHPDDGSNEYFSIPADFFSGTWADGDSFVFYTTAAATGSASYGSAHSGSIALGTMSAPAYVRMEAVYTYPNGTNTMTIIFPRANVTSSVDIDMQIEDSAAVPITFEAKRADSEVSGGNAAWDAKPLGVIIFA